MTLTKEWLQKAISDIETMHDETPFGLDEDDSNTLAALRIALASLEAEPVAWLRESAVNDIHEGAWTPIIQMESQRMGANLTEAWGVSYIPLYSAPQLTTSERAELENYRNAQQVVPDEAADHRDAFEAVFPIPLHAERCGAGYCCTAYNAWDAHKFVNRWDGWKACRAAMLQGAEHVSNRDELPDGWVAVPVEPTAEMYDAGDRQLATKQVWDAMIAAAPQQEVISKN